MINRKLLDKIYNKHVKRLKNRSIKNKKLLICFGAVPASGKSYISKILETKYKGIRISTEEIGKIINSLKQRNKKEILDEYLYYYLREHCYPNGLIILDASIDRRYEDVFLAATDAGFDLFIININVSRKTIIERIRRRNKRGAKSYFKEMNRWYREHKLFKDKVIVDIAISNETELNLAHLFMKLDRKLKK